MQTTESSGGQNAAGPIAAMPEVGQWLARRDEAAADMATAQDRYQELLSLPDDGRRGALIAEAERYQTYALAFLALRLAHQAETFDTASSHAWLAGAIARRRMDRKPDDRLAHDLAAAAKLPGLRWATTFGELEAAWQALAEAKTLCERGTGDAGLAAACDTERAALLYRCGCLQAARRVANRAARRWEALGETNRARNARGLARLVRAEVRANCLPAPGDGRPLALDLAPGFRLGRLLGAALFQTALEGLGRERASLAAVSCAGRPA